MFIKLIKTEISKAKHSSTYWFTLLAACLVPVVLFLVYFFKWEHFVSPADINPWSVYLSRAFKVIASFLFPVYAIMLIALNAQLEHKNNMWKKLYILPIKREQIYLSKLVFLSLCIFGAIILFSVSLFVFALLNSLIHPELGFLKHSPDLLILSKYILKLYLSVLGIISIQMFVSMISRNMIVPLATGIFILIASSILVLGWKGSIYNPYAFPAMLTNEMSGLINPKQLGFMSIPEFVSCLVFIIVTIPAAMIFSREDIKN